MTTRIVRPASLIVMGCMVLLAVAGCARCADETAQAPQPRLTTIILVRHAQVDRSAQIEDPPLSALGQARARALAHAAGEAGISAIYTSQYLRTRQTVQPIADQLGLPVYTIKAEDVKGLVALVLSEHAGQVVLIAGHGDTVPAIIDELDGDWVPPMVDEFDNLYVVTIGGPGKARVLHLNYGDPG